MFLVFVTSPMSPGSVLNKSFTKCSYNQSKFYIILTHSKRDISRKSKTHRQTKKWYIQFQLVLIESKKSFHSICSKSKPLALIPFLAHVVLKMTPSIYIFTDYFSDYTYLLRHKSVNGWFSIRSLISDITFQKKFDRCYYQERLKWNVSNSCQ